MLHVSDYDITNFMDICHKKSLVMSVAHLLKTWSMKF